MTDWTPLIALHALGATVAISLGGYLILRRRKGDARHRRLGRLWMFDMYWVAFSSFGIQRLSPGHFTWIHALSMWTIFSLTMAIRAARRHRIKKHRAWIIGTYCGLLGAGIAAAAFPARLVPETAIHHPLWLVGGLLVAALITVIGMKGVPRRPVRSPETPHTPILP